MKFQEAFEQSGLKEKYNSSGHFALGRFEEDNARLILSVVAAHNDRFPNRIITPVKAAFTHQSEASHRLCPPPNTNGTNDLAKWDIGPQQANMGQWKKDTTAGDYHAYPEALIFGTVFYELDGVTPCRFSGSPYWGLMQMVARITAYHRLNDEAQVVFYCGPEGRPGRQKAWRYWAPLYEKFFELYEPPRA